MRVLDRRRFRADPDALLDDLAPGGAEIVLLQIGAPQSRRLLHPPARRPAPVRGGAHHALPGVVPFAVTLFTFSAHHPPFCHPPFTQARCAPGQAGRMRWWARAFHPVSPPPLTVEALGVWR